MLAIFALAFWAAFSQPARAGLLIATLAGGVSGVSLTIGVLSGYAQELEALTFGAYARSLVISETRFVDDRFGPPRLPDIARLHEALGADIEAIAAWRTTFVDARAGVEQANLPVFGVMGAFHHEADMPVARGRTLTREETQSAERVCTLGAGAARLLFGDAQAVGERVRLNGVSCEVVGVYGEARSQLAERYRQAVLAPFITTARYFENSGTGVFETGPQDVARLTVILRDGVDRDSALIGADRVLRRAQGARMAAAPPFVYADPAAPTRSLMRQRNLVARLLFAIAGVSSLVAVTGYAAASIAAVDMRRREIALQMMSGATGRSILAQVLAEGLILALLASSIGLFIVTVGAKLAQSAVRFPFYLSPEVAGLTLIAGATVGVLASLWPAQRAASGSPALSARA